MLDTKRQKKERKKKTKASEEAEELEEEMASLPKPSILGLWPFRLPGFVVWCVCSIPSVVTMVREEVEERRRRRQEMEDDDDDNDPVEKGETSW